MPNDDDKAAEYLRKIGDGVYGPGGTPDAAREGFKGFRVPIPASPPIPDYPGGPAKFPGDAA
jgi:hypothetical protein